MAEGRPPVEHVCEQCSEPFTSNRKTHRFCSYRCNKAWQSAKHWSAGYTPPVKPRPCAWCGVEFARNRTDTTCCSKVCAAQARRAADEPARELLRQQTVVRHQAEQASAREERLRFEAEEITCQHCGALFPRGQRSTFCSTTCGIKHHTEKDYRRDPRPCTWCGEVFVPPPGQGGKRLCSAECKRLQNREVWNAGKQARRARKKLNTPNVETIYRGRIFKRDRYRCCLCGLKLNMDVLVPHPDAATLDHIIPLSKGGPHTSANLQAAHFRCNLRKHDGVNAGAEQLRLLG